MTHVMKFGRLLSLECAAGLALAVLAMPKPAAAAIIVVTATQTVPGQGCSFEEAVNALNNRVGGDCVAGNGNNDTIRIRANPAPYVASSINVDIHRSVTIEGEGSASTVLQFSGGARGGETALRTSGGSGVIVTIRDLTLRGTAGNQLSGFENQDATLTLTRLRVTNFGYAGIHNVSGSVAIDSSLIDNDGIFGELPLGGGILNYGTLTVTSSTITENFAFDGGGLANFGSLEVASSSITNNEAIGNGGGAYTQSSATLFTRVVFDNNTADAGGGLYIDLGGTGYLQESALTNNQATDGGGVAVNGGGSPAAFIFFSNSLFAYNYADARGGGLFSTGQVGPNNINSTFSHNRAAYGGGIWQDSGGEFDIYFSTFAHNHATEQAGGLHVAAGTVAFSYNLIGNNTTDGTFPDVWTNHAGPFGSYNLVESTGGGIETAFPTAMHNILGRDPNIGDLQNLGGPTAVHPLLDKSNAIDAIPEVDFNPSDQRGFPRPQDGNDDGTSPPNGFDIGAYEQGPNEPIFGFELASAWTSSAPLSLSSTFKTQGLFGLSVGGSGYRVLNSAPLKTPVVPLSATLSIDFFLPGNQPNPWWFGAVQSYASCPSAGLYNVFLGQVELTGKPVNAFSALQFSMPANVRAAFSESRTDCFLSVAVNTNATPLAPVVDNLRFSP